ncbi:unnamed protein product [Blepharisma stoltei]|uniref:Uncharacterized protein n=1 Tax=Blepharisma stoltei TaxID=1481888 RepID=A0AAU9IS41_9CILI|nr:unnamed protein product [Blepharisma stoltei]
MDPDSGVISNSNDFKSPLEAIRAAFRQSQGQNSGSFYFEFSPNVVKDRAGNTEFTQANTRWAIESQEEAINRQNRQAAAIIDRSNNELKHKLTINKLETERQLKLLENQYELQIHELDKNQEMQQAWMQFQYEMEQAQQNYELEKYRESVKNEIAGLHDQLEYENQKIDSECKIKESRLRHEILRIEENSKKEINQLKMMNLREIALSECERDIIINDYREKAGIKIQKIKSRTQEEETRMRCEAEVKIAKIWKKVKMLEIGLNIVSNVISLIPALNKGVGLIKHL